MNDCDVIIITHDRPHKLLRCVRHILNGNVLPQTIIIIHSAPPKECVTKRNIIAICRNQGVRIIYKHVPHNGISYSRNAGISSAKSKYYCFIDDDEFPPVQWLETASELLKKHTYQVLSGPKIPRYPENYWNRIWQHFLHAGVNQEITKVSFVTSSNTFFRTSLIRGRRIRYDHEFRTSSEDKVFSFKLIKSGVKMYHANNLFVYHDFRTDFRGFLRQWLDYGWTMCLFHMKYETESSRFTPARMIACLRSRDLIQNLSGYPRRLWPGLLILDKSYVIGYLSAYVRYMLK